MARANVLLLRTPSESDDPYDNHLRASGFLPTSLTVLETTLVGLDVLSSTLRKPPEPKCKGVILTSARAAHAWWGAVQILLGSPATSGPRREALERWSALPFYVVGAATATALRQPPSAPAPAPAPALPVPHDIRGAQSGTGEALARFVLADLGAGGAGASVLLLVGDKNTDTVPEILREGGVQSTAMQVYATRAAESFPGALERLLEDRKDGAQPWWIVFFAPSSSKFALPSLLKHFSLPTSGAENASETDPASTKVEARVAAVGPTTTRFLTEEAHLRVDLTSPKPTAEALAAALGAFERHDLGVHSYKIEAMAYDPSTPL